MLNTPPTYAWYIAGLVFKWLKRQGGLAAMGERNRAKAALLYDCHRRLVVLRESGREGRALVDERAVHARATRSSTRPSSTEAKAAGLRHARRATARSAACAPVDLQRDADRGREGAGRLHEGLSSAAACAEPTAVQDPHAQQHLAARPRAPAARSLRRRATTSPIPTRSSCARPTCTRMAIPASVKAVGARRRGHQQHSGRGAVGARRSGVQRAGRERQRGQGARHRRHVARGAQHLPGAGLRRASSSGDDRALDEAVEKGKKNVRRLRAAGHDARRRRARRDRRRGRERGARARHARARLRSARSRSKRAWQLSSGVERAASLDELFARADFVTLHVPLRRRDAQPRQRGATRG